MILCSRGYSLKKGVIGFHKSGISVARLTSNQTIGGIEYLASGLGPFFNENGEVVNATLARDTEIDGILYMAGQQITFHSKGRVNSGRVARAVQVQAASYSPGDMIYFDSKGAVRDLNRLNLFNAEPEPVTVAKDYIGRTFATTRPLAYQVGLPRRNQVSRYIADNSLTLFTEKADRRTTVLHTLCN